MIRLALALARTVCMGRWARGEQAVCDVARWLGYGEPWQAGRWLLWWPTWRPARCKVTLLDGPGGLRPGNCGRLVGHSGLHIPYSMDHIDRPRKPRTPFRRGGDLWGGRVISSMPLLGGLHLGLRADASALTADFAAANPGTWRSVEGYVAASRPFRVLGVCSIGPAVVVGVLAPITTEASWSSRPMAGAGTRLACGSSWLYTLAGPNKAADARAEAPPETAPGKGPGVRVMVAAQLELGRLSLVSDWVSGAGGYLRGGLAIRVPVPWGAK